MNEQKLKPCPFCGGQAEFKDMGSNRLHIYCFRCECRMGAIWGDNETRADLIRLWNTRHAPISDKELDKLAKIATEDYPEHRAMYEAFFRQGFKQALSQGNPALTKRLWTLWESLAEAGELSADKTFIANYNRLKKEV